MRPVRTSGGSRSFADLITGSHSGSQGAASPPTMIFPLACSGATGSAAPCCWERSARACRALGCSGTGRAVMHGAGGLSGRSVGGKPLSKGRLTPRARMGVHTRHGRAVTPDRLIETDRHRPSLARRHQPGGNWCWQPASMGALMPVARSIRAWLARIRAAVYAGLEEVRFRTGVAVLAGTAAVIGGVATAAVVAARGAPPAPAHGPLDGQAPPALSAWLPRHPSLAPEPGRRAPPARRAGPASRAGNAYAVASNAPRADLTPRHGQWVPGRGDHPARPGRHRHGRGPHHYGRHRRGWGPGRARRAGKTGRKP